MPKAPPKPNPRTPSVAHTPQAHGPSPISNLGKHAKTPKPQPDVVSSVYGE